MSTHTHEDELLTVQELAREWKQHPSTVYKKISHGTIPAIRLGDEASAVRIPRAALEESIHRDPGGSSSSLRPETVERRAPAVPAVAARPLAGAEES
jgi:excisionase family DNA binding protein